MPEARQVEKLLNRSFEIVQTGVLTVASPNLVNSSNFQNVDFGFDFEPIVFAFASFSSTGTRFILPYQSFDLTGGANAGKMTGEVSYELVDKIITFYFRNVVAALNQTAYIRYYICRDPAA